MRGIRRVLQVATFVGTLMIGVLAIALIVSQTPWFRDWLRRYIVRESKQYLNGELTIGRGSLFWRGGRRQKEKRLSWSRFAELMDDLAYDNT